MSIELHLFLFLYKTNFIAGFLDPFPQVLQVFLTLPSIPPRTNGFLSEQEDDLPAEVVSGFNNAK